MLRRLPSSVESAAGAVAGTGLDLRTLPTAPENSVELVGSDVLVTGGLEAGDKIAISGVSQLRPGMKVRPVAVQ